MHDVRAIARAPFIDESLDEIDNQSCRGLFVFGDFPLYRQTEKKKINYIISHDKRKKKRNAIDLRDFRRRRLQESGIRHVHDSIFTSDVKNLRIRNREYRCLVRPEERLNETRENRRRSGDRDARGKRNWLFRRWRNCRWRSVMLRTDK